MHIFSRFKVLRHIFLAWQRPYIRRKCLMYANKNLRHISQGISKKRILPKE